MVLGSVTIKKENRKIEVFSSSLNGIAIGSPRIYALVIKTVPQPIMNIVARSHRVTVVVTSIPAKDTNIIKIASCPHLPGVTQ